MINEAIYLTTINGEFGGTSRISIDKRFKFIINLSEDFDVKHDLIQIIDNELIDFSNFKLAKLIYDSL